MNLFPSKRSPLARLLGVLSVLSLGFFATIVHGHNGGILVQGLDGRLVTGRDDEVGAVQTIGDRAFSLLFPASLANDVPSFLSLTQAPSGSEPLPVGGDLYWDFLPMQIGELSSNLLYWDALSDEVEFGEVPATDVEFSLWTDMFTDRAIVTGTSEPVAGKHLGTINDSLTALHAHRWFFLEAEGAVPEGVYLVALQLRMEGFERSEPLLIAAATDNVSAAVLDEQALPWVQQRVDLLILPGDFDFDGDVDGNDLLYWQRGETSAFPGSHFLGLWQANFSAPPAAELRSLPIPEPSVAALIWFAISWFLLLPHRRLSDSLSR